jgi:hypothetical protein
VMDALKELVNQIGWNLSWKYNASAGAFRLTLWQPARTSTSALYEFTTDDYYMIPRTSLDLAGIRNACEVVYTDTDGSEQDVTSTGSASISLYGRRFMRIDARGTSVVTSGQATTLADAVVDDLEEPNVQQEADCAFFWPAELGDVYNFAPNRHYSSAQQYAVFGYRHVLTENEKRTQLRVSGKPSGGYMRWHNQEVDEAASETRIWHLDTTGRSHTGDTSKTTLETVAMPIVRFMYGFRVRATWAFAGTAGVKTVEVEIDDGSITPSIALWQMAATDLSLLEMDFVVTVLGNAAARSSAPVQGSPTLTYLPTATLTSPIDLVFSVTLASAADSAVLAHSEVELMPEAP